MSKYLSEYKELMLEWDWEANAGLDPNKITYGSNKKAWWICKKGHEWLAALYSRKAGSNCPKCAKENAKRKHKNKNQLEFDFEK